MAAERLKCDNYGHQEYDTAKDLDSERSVEHGWLKIGSLRIKFLVIHQVIGILAREVI